jgi:tetratricopeptide (TPR) repeat protein
MWFKMRGLAASEHSVASILIAVASIVVYANTLGNGFVFDDIYMIVKNELIRIVDLPAIFSTNYWGPSKNQGLYRPLVVLSYALNYKVGGLNPFSYHLVNLVFHALNCILVYHLVFIVSRKRRVAAFTALLFATHPVHTEAVAGVVGRAELFAAFFLLLALLLYIRESRWAVVPFLLALLSKENAVVLLPILLLYDISFRDIRLRRYLSLVLLTVLWLVVRHSITGTLGPRDISYIANPLAHISLYPRLLTGVKVLVMYLRLLALPVGLSADYSYNQIPVSTSIFELWTFFPMLVLAAISLLVYWSYKNSKELFFFIALLLVALLPASNLVIPIGTIMGERLLYLPSLGFCTALGILFNAIYEKPSQKKIAAFTFILVLLLYSGATIDRNTDWKDNLTLWQKTVKTSPNSALAHYNLGFFYAERRMYDLAIAEYKRSLNLAPKDIDVHFSIATFFGRVHTNLGVVYFKKGLFDLAMDEFKEALKLNPNDAKAHVNLAIIYDTKGLYDLAIIEFKKALNINPQNPKVHYGLSIVYLKKGLYDLARQELEEALELDPDNVLYRNNLEELENLNPTG